MICAACARPCLALALALAGAAAGLAAAGGRPATARLSGDRRLLLGAVLLVPPLTQHLIAALPHTGSAVTDTALAQLHGSLGSSTVSLASIIVSFSLMVAMAIMVHSFRESVRPLAAASCCPPICSCARAVGSDTALSPLLQQRLEALDGIGHIEFRRAAIDLSARRSPGGDADRA